jgi:zinc and cadmium transporter
MQLLVSLIGGLMLGVAIFHQFPHAVEQMSGNGQSAAFALDWCVGWLMAGLLTTFLMLRIFHFHHHETVAMDEDPDHLCGHDHDHDHDCLASHDHDHDHDSGGHKHTHHPSQGASWVGIFVGMAIHSLMDGGSLAAYVAAEATHGPEVWLLALGPFLSVVLHKPLDSLSITTLMAAGGWPARTRQMVNIGYALICPIGAAIVFMGVQQAGYKDVLLSAAMAFSAGMFLCISLSDLLPEVQFHSHDRTRLSAALLFGVLLAWLIGFAEHGAMHGQGNPHIHDADVHDHHGHNHGHKH